MPGFTRLFDRSYIFDGRDISRVEVQDHCFEDAAHDLAATRLGQGVDDVDVADYDYGSQLVPHRIAQRTVQLV
jgi:hypothetical protein